MFWARKAWDDSDRASLEVFEGIFSTCKPLIIDVFLAPIPNFPFRCTPINPSCRRTEKKTSGSQGTPSSQGQGVWGRKGGTGVDPAELYLYQ